MSKGQAEMNMHASALDRPFDPDWAVHPGEVIREMCEERGIRQAHLAGMCRVSPKHMNQVVNGRVPLRAELAVAIEFAFSARCAQLLMRMQADYDVHQARAEQAERVAEMARFIKETKGG